MNLSRRDETTSYERGASPEGARMDKGSTLGRPGATCAALLAARSDVPGAAQQDEDGGSRGRADAIPVPASPHPTIDRTKILNDRNIVFVTRDDTIYNNELPKRMPEPETQQLGELRHRRTAACARATGSRSCGRPARQLSARRRVSARQFRADHAKPSSTTSMAMTEENRERRRRGRSKREAVTTEQVELPPAAAAPAAGQRRAPRQPSSREPGARPKKTAGR